MRRERRQGVPIAVFVIVILLMAMGVAITVMAVLIYHQQGNKDVSQDMSIVGHSEAIIQPKIAGKLDTKNG